MLPAAARATVQKHFKSGISLVKIDKSWGRVSDYEVILDNGTEVTFDRGGNWTDLEAGRASAVPASLLPKGIADYVKANHRGAAVVGVEKHRSGYDVELSNDIELRFDLQGRFVRYDD